MSTKLDTREGEHFESNTQHHFKNMFGELDYYKKKCDLNEKDLSKLQMQIKKLESVNKKLQDINDKNTKVH